MVDVVCSLISLFHFQKVLDYGDDVFPRQDGCIVGCGEIETPVDSVSSHYAEIVFGWTEK